MKKLSLLLLVVTCSTCLQAQEQYIEVVVSDTMTIEPKEWNYFLFMQERAEGEEGASVKGKPGIKNNLPRGKPVQLIVDSIRAIAVGFGGEITGDRKAPLNFTMTPKSYYGTSEPEYLSIRFTSRQAMEAFVRAINKRGDVEGRITTALNPDMPPYTDKLTARMIEMAKEKAAKLAQLAGRKAGSIILISEVADPGKNTYQGLFEKMMESDRASWLPGWVGQSAEYVTDKIKLEKTLRVRFAWQ